jgi:hypothetical protein
VVEEELASALDLRVLAAVLAAFDGLLDRAVLPLAKAEPRSLEVARSLGLVPIGERGAHVLYLYERSALHP